MLQRFKKIDSLKLFYNSQIKSILMYGSIIWSPHTQEKIYDIEKIQHQILIIFAFKLNIEFDYFKHDYNDLYTKFKINNLESAREISDLKFLYKLINNKITCPEIRSVIKFYIPNRNGLRERNLMFTIPIEFKNCRKTSSLLRIQETHNLYNKKK